MNHITNREKQIANLIVQGKTRRDIERGLSLSPSTLRVHVSRLCAKLGITYPNPLYVERALLQYQARPRPAALKPPKLARCEREVIEMRIAGRTFRQIAEARQCAVSTVLCISSNACRKLRIRKSTNPATLTAALTAFDTPPDPDAPMSPANPMHDPAFL